MSVQKAMTPNFFSSPPPLFSVLKASDLIKVFIQGWFTSCVLWWYQNFAIGSGCTHNEFPHSSVLSLKMWLWLFIAWDRAYMRSRCSEPTSLGIRCEPWGDYERQFTPPFQDLASASGAMRLVEHGSVKETCSSWGSSKVKKESAWRSSLFRQFSWWNCFICERWSCVISAQLGYGMFKEKKTDAFVAWNHSDMPRKSTCSCIHPFIPHSCTSSCTSGLCYRASCHALRHARTWCSWHQHHSCWTSSV